MTSTTNVRETAGASTGDVREALRDVFGSSVDSLERRRHAYQTSVALEELDLRLADGRLVHLLFKNLGAPSEKALRTKPAFLRDPLREITVYLEVLDGSGLGTAHCYGAVADPARGRYWLFIEHVPGIVLWQVAELAVWQDVARWLVGLHTRLPRVEQRNLLTYDRSLYETWLRRALAGSAGAGLEPLAGAHETVVRRLLELPTTFIHGELYPSNVLVHRRAGRTRVCPIDWEMAAVGPALLDLAALTAGDWSDEERDSIVLAYHGALPAPPPLADFLESIECCRLHLAVQWLGWASNDWSPPAEHSQDWLAEALRAAERLGLA